MSVEVGLQEAPRCPESINRELQRFDSRLRCVFNIQNRVWQIQERIERTGVWSHVVFWHDGPWNRMEFKQLPGSAEPLIARVVDVDMTRRGKDLKQFIAELNAKGATRRAQLMDAMAEKWAVSMLNYARYLKANLPRLMRGYSMGGRSRVEAIKERQQAIRDAGGA